MTKEDFKNYLNRHEHIYPDIIIKRRIIYKGYEVFEIGWDSKEYIGLPVFYLVNEKDEVTVSDLKERAELLKLTRNK